MNVLFHTVEYYPTSVAAAYRMKVFADEMSGRGHNVTVITERKKTSGKQQGFRENVIYAPTVPMKRKTMIWRLLNNMSYAITSCFCAMKAGKVDVVVTTTPPALISISGWLIAKMKRAKLVYDVKDIWPDVAIEMNQFSENGFYSKLFGWITRFMCKHADLVTAVSKRKVTKLKERYLYGDEEKVVLVGNGFNIHDVENTIDQAVVEAYDLDRMFTCVYIGNIGIAQGLDSLLEIAGRSKHKNVQFLIFGDGAERAELEERVQREKLSQVRILGAVPHEKVFTVLSKAKINYIPLISEKMTDTIPTKLYEALGLGCPVMLVAEGDACDLLDEAKLGVHVSPADKERFADVFDRMVDDYEAVSENREYARKIIRENYTRQQAAIKLERYLQELVQESVKVGE